jgi:hypothetical protein
VTVDGTLTNVTLSLPGPVTVDGSLVLSPTPSGYAMVGTGPTTGPLTVASGGSLSTGGSGSIAYLRTPITNQSGGTVTIGSPSTNQDSGTADTNSGTFQVLNGGDLIITGGSTLSNQPTGTLGVTVNGVSGTGGILGSGVSLAGSLAVTTAAPSPVGTNFVPISGVASGTFSTFSFGPNAYVVTYPGNELELTTATPFRLTAKQPVEPASQCPTPKSVCEGLAFSGQVGTIVAGSQSGPVYTASINWGDNTNPSTGTVNGGTGSVSGTHTYASTGTFTVAVTVSNQFGTTEVVTTQANVVLAPAPTVTGVSPSTLLQGAKSVTLTVTGTNFTNNSTSTVAFSAAGVTVSSVTWKNASTLTVKAAIASNATTGAGDVSVTTPGGTATCTGCLTIDAPPTITSVSGGPLAPGATTTVTVGGTGFQTGLQVTTTIPGATVGIIGSPSATSFTVPITVPSGTATGNYALTVTNPDGGKVTFKKLSVH